MIKILQVNGHPWWPSYVWKQEAKDEFSVVFYGTNEVAKIPRSKIKKRSVVTDKKLISNGRGKANFAAGVNLFSNELL